MVPKTVLDLIEKTATSFENNIAVGDENKDITYKELIEGSKRIGTNIANYGFTRKPIAILMNRKADLPVAIIGCVYSGNFYVILDADSPIDRLEKIVNTLNPAAIIFENCLKDMSDKFSQDILKLEYEEIAKEQIDEDVLLNVRSNMTSTDPIYSIFTSGSTGFPKGALLTHQNVISYIDWYVKCFAITDKTVFGSQTPLYFSMSVSDFFASMFTGASYQMIPKQYFTFPAKLIQFMNAKKVNTIYWVPSALYIVAKLDILKYCKPEYLEKILFAGEVMPVKCLNYWKKYYNDAMFANLFGPTETTDICSYYVVNREFEEYQTLPIGNACDNCKLFIVDDNSNEVLDGSEGELYVAGPFLASGYYNNAEKTKEVFVQNPLHSLYPEIVYKTGDIVKRNEFGEIEYLGRKDFQIKHMGYRIELGEIEAVIGSVEGVELAVCVYDAPNDRIAFFYEGDKELQDTLIETLKSKLAVYMQPELCKHLLAFPKNANGKIDRLKLREMI